MHHANPVNWKQTALNSCLVVGQLVIESTSLLTQLLEITKNKPILYVASLSACVDASVLENNLQEVYFYIHLLMNKKVFRRFLIKKKLETFFNQHAERAEFLEIKLETFFKLNKIHKAIHLKDQQDIQNLLTELKQIELEYSKNNQAIAGNNWLVTELNELQKLLESHYFNQLDFDEAILKTFFELRKDLKLANEKKHSNLINFLNKKINFTCDEINAIYEKSLEESNQNLSCCKSYLKFMPEVNSYIKTKLSALGLAVLFSLCAGVTTGIVFFYTFPGALLGLGVCLAAPYLTWLVLCLSIIAAVSYTLLIYNTLANLIMKETLTQWWKNLNNKIANSDKENKVKYAYAIVKCIVSSIIAKLIKWLTPKDQESWFLYAARIVLSFAAIIFGVFASSAVGYTAFIQLTAFLNVSLCVLVALPIWIADLIFTLTNSLRSIAMCGGFSMSKFNNALKNKWKKFVMQLATENILQWLLHIIRLPLQFLLSLFVGALLLLHIGCSAVGYDRLGKIPIYVTIIVSSISELLTDIFPIFGNRAEHEHEHDHGGLFNWVIKFVFIFPATILGVVNFIFSQLNYFSNNAMKKSLGFTEAILQEWERFDIYHPKHEKDNVEKMNLIPSKLSEKNVFDYCLEKNNEDIMRLNKEKNKTTDTKQIMLLQNKLKVLKKEKNQIFFLQGKKINDELTLSDIDDQILNQNRSRIFSKAITKTCQNFRERKLLQKNNKTYASLYECYQSNQILLAT